MYCRSSEMSYEYRDMYHTPISPISIREALANNMNLNSTVETVPYCATLKLELILTDRSELHTAQSFIGKKIKIILDNEVETVKPKDFRIEVKQKINAISQLEVEDE